MTDRIDRRDFLSRSAFLGGSFALPAWAARAFSRQDPAAEPERVAALRAAVARATARGRPVLVFVVPTGPAELWNRGRDFGAFLNFATDAALLDLALTEPACATLADIETVTHAKVAGDPSLVLVEITAAQKPRLSSIEPDLADLPEAPDLAQAGTYEAWRTAQEKRQREINERIHAALRRAVVRDVAALAARADAVRATLSDADRDALRACVEAGEALDPRIALDLSAPLRMAAAAPRREGDRERIDALVVATARSFFVGQRLPGAKWATSDGCGLTIEGEEEAGLAVACGMGMVAPLSRRFLYFYTGE